MTMPSQQLPCYEDVLRAAHNLQKVTGITPVRRSTSADRRHHATFFFKCENLQRSGSFKFRGAYHALSQFTQEQRKAGVLTFSAGNHAQAVALAAQLLDIPALIVMPENAATTKMAATREYGAQVVTYNPRTEDRLAISQKLANDRGMTLVPPSDHRDVIAGQGTAAKELLEQVPDLDVLLVCVGGGGLLAGTVLAAQALAPQCQIIGVEPEAANDAQQSLRKGELIQIPYPTTIADGAQAQCLGQMPWALIRQHVKDIVTASDLQLMHSIRFFAERMKIVVEPTGALAFAGAEAGQLNLAGKRVGVMVSGGNVDLPRYARFIAD